MEDEVMMIMMVLSILRASGDPPADGTIGSGSSSRVGTLPRPVAAKIGP
jgi:hypothetical protein